MEKQDLSRRLDELFTTELESIIRTEPAYRHIYVVYSGGDDLFLLGPWDKLIRFVDAFQSHLAESLKADYPRLTLSAGFKLAHPKSPVRFLADDVETALEAAKKHCNRRVDDPTKRQEKPHKNCICIFERIMNWEELHAGLGWADEFIKGDKEYNLSRGLLQRLQYYGDQLREFFDGGKMDGLRAIPLLQDDWRRNVGRVKEPLKTRLKNEIQPQLTQLNPQGERMWRIIECASRFAVYALR